MKKYRIYVLINPITQEIFYVGKTEQKLEKRRDCHLYGYSNPKNPRSMKVETIIDILSNGSIPIVKEIDYAYTLKEALERERFWIFELFKTGSPITNREVCKHPQYEVYFTTNFPYGIAVSVEKETPTKILLYSKGGNKYYPEYVIEKDHPNYIEVHDNYYEDGLCQKLITLREEVFPFLRRPKTDFESYYNSSLK